MFVQVQFPFFDGRYLKAKSGVLPYPNWQDLGGAPAYVRHLGKIMPRAQQGVEGLPSESYYCQMRKRLRATSDWADPFPVTSPSLNLQGQDKSDNRNRARFVVRRFFFDGYYSGKLDLGFFLPVHLFEEWRQEDTGAPMAIPFSDKMVATTELAVKHLLSRTVAFAGAKTSIMGIRGVFPKVYARATEPSSQSTDLVAMRPPVVYIETIKPDHNATGNIKGWARFDRAFGEVYYRRVSISGSELPIFLVRMDSKQKQNRGRHFRIATLRVLSELANAQMLMAKVRTGHVTFDDNDALRPFVHAHLKRTLKFLTGKVEEDYIVNALSLNREIFGKDHIEATVEKLSSLDGYWEEAKRRSFMEVIMGDKISATTGGVAIGGKAKIGGSIATNSQNVTQTFDLVELASALEKIAAKLDAKADDPSAKVDGMIVKEAAKQAKAGDENGVISMLKKVGGTFLDVAKDVGAKVAVEFAKAKLGL